MKLHRPDQPERWLAGAVALAALAAALVLLFALERGVIDHAEDLLDSRVMCDKLGPTGCEPRTA